MLLRHRQLSSVHVAHMKYTASYPTEVMPVPAFVRISMSQNIGAPCNPTVKPGDYVRVGTKIGDSEAFLSVPVHSSVSGTVRAIEKQRGFSGAMDTVIVIDTDGIQEMDPDLRRPGAIHNHEEFIHIVRQSGLVGLGGASFPTWVKLDPKNRPEIKTLIVNGAECEPYITSDYRTMMEAPKDVIAGALVTMRALTAEQGGIAIEENKPDAIALFQQLLKERNIPNLRVHVLPSRYPKGAERVLIYEITGKECPAGVLPAQLGVVVSNVSTIAFLASYLRTGVPLVNKWVTIDGDAVAHPKNVIAPVGTIIYDAVQFCGGYKKEPKKIIMGGPMMGRAVYSDRFSIVKNNNGILIFSEDMTFLPEETACINCGRCHSVCPFGLLPTALAEAFERHDAKRLNELQVMQCMECGSCSYVCPAHRPLSFMNKLGKAMVKEATAKK